MPKIAAPTVAQHRAMAQCRPIDVAEETMRSDEPEKLAAGAVTVATRTARNNIYRYVDSVNDLRGLVLTRHLPAWIDIVTAEPGAVEAPTECTVVWVRANLQQATRTGHGWLMGLSRSIMPSLATAKVMDDSHAVMRDLIAQVWAALVQDLMQLRVVAGLTRDLLEAGSRQFDSGIPVDMVANLGEKAARSPVVRITSGNS